jgi:hypothetical protein
MSILARNVKNITLSNSDLCVVLRYLTSRDRIGYIEVQIHKDKVHIFLRNFPNAPYCSIRQDETSNRCALSILNAVIVAFPNNILDFERGYNL